MEDSKVEILGTHPTNEHVVVDYIGRDWLVVEPVLMLVSCTVDGEPRAGAFLPNGTLRIPPGVGQDIVRLDARSEPKGQTWRSLIEEGISIDEIDVDPSDFSLGAVVVLFKNAFARPRQQS